MKLVYCLECGDIFSPGVKTPSRCRCGYSVAKWRDPQTGTLEVASRSGDENHLRILGLNNGWLSAVRDIPDLPRTECDQKHREATQNVCDLSAGYLFQTQSRNCPIIMVRPDGWQIFYEPDLLNHVPWFGKNDYSIATDKPEHRFTGEEIAKVRAAILLAKEDAKEWARLSRPKPEDANRPIGAVSDYEAVQIGKVIDRGKVRK